MSHATETLSWPQRLVNWRNLVWAGFLSVVAFSAAWATPDADLRGGIIFASFFGVAAALSGPLFLPFHDNWRPRLILMGCMTGLALIVATDMHART